MPLVGASRLPFTEGTALPDNVSFASYCRVIDLVLKYGSYKKG